MSFMQPFITDLRTWWKIDGYDGVMFFDADDFSRNEAINAYPAEPVYWNKITGYGARMSAPGYMDCTDWCVFFTAADAAQHLIDMYFDMPDDEMSEDDQITLRALTLVAKGATS